MQGLPLDGCLMYGVVSKRVAFVAGWGLSRPRADPEEFVGRQHHRNTETERCDLANPKALLTCIRNPFASGAVYNSPRRS
jgi:hypothetical protein